MSFEFPLVIFTTFSQFAVGAAIFLCVDEYANQEGEGGAARRRKLWIWTAIASLVAILASLFHLGHPFQAPKALFNLGQSWLSREVLLFAIFCVLSFINIPIRSKALTLCAACVGCAGLLAQGLTYGPPSMPELHNAFTMFLFVLSALALGASVQNLLAPQSGAYLSRPFIIALIAILLLAPWMWLSGSTTMLLSGEAWLGSPPFWAGLLLIGIALVATYRPKTLGTWQLISLLCGIVLTRMTFFADSVHTAANLGLPYN